MSGGNAIKKLLATAEPPELGPGPRAGVQAEAALNQALARSLSESRLPAQGQQLVRALVLLWHDHLEPAHVIAQNLESADGAFVHGIMHRREPDYGNAKYWFRRVGAHEAFAEIARRVLEMPKAEGLKAVQSQLVVHGKWDPFGFVDACEQAAKRPASDARNWLLRQVQGIEMETLLDWFSGQAPPP